MDFVKRCCISGALEDRVRQEDIRASADREIFGVLSKPSYVVELLNLIHINLIPCINRLAAASLHLGKQLSNMVCE